MKNCLGPATFPKPQREGYSVWCEEGNWYIAPTVDPKQFDSHRFSGYFDDKNLGDCSCGCSMGGFHSDGPVDPFGACPKNPKK